MKTLTTHIPATQPHFIVFEGINGCGKTTLMRAVAARLREAGEVVCETREPGGTPLGVELRRLLLAWDGARKSDRTELLLFAADRAEHIDKVVLPALARGEWVLCDRYIYSTIAFQGYGRGVRRDWIDHANELAIQGTTPDLVVLLDLDPSEALRRINARSGNGADAFEDEAISFHNRIRAGFLECAASSPTPFCVLDAAQSPAALVEATLRLVLPSAAR
jgi:dTMP kinase